MYSKSNLNNKKLKLDFLYGFENKLQFIGRIKNHMMILPVIKKEKINFLFHFDYFYYIT